LSTAYVLLEVGASVRLYESGLPGNGQSGGETRVFRHAHDDPRLVEFARSSRALWDEWADRLGVELISRDGAIAIGPASSRRLAVIEEVGGVPARAIGPAELAERLPILAGYEGPAMLDEAGGAIRVKAAIDALAGQIGDGLVRDEVISVARAAGARWRCAPAACVPSTRASLSARAAAPGRWHGRWGSRFPCGWRRTPA
jgi:sarcosine oxidase